MQFSMNKIVYATQILAIAFVFFLPVYTVFVPALIAVNCFQLTVTYNIGNYCLFKVTQPLQRR